MKKAISFIIILTIVLFFSQNLSAKAITNESEGNDQIIDMGGAEYSKSAHILWYNCTFHVVIDTINLTQNTFTGTFYYTGDLNNSQTITGTYSNMNFSFHVSLGWGGDFNLELNDDLGILYGTNTLEPILGVDETYYGPPHAFQNASNTSSLDNELYTLCRDASTRIYKSNTDDGNGSIHPKKLYEDFVDNEYEDILFDNFNDDSEDNVSYIIGHKTLSNEERIFVVIRGSDGVEWKGNMKICPPDSNGNDDIYTFGVNDDKTHNSFKVAATEMQNIIKNYINKPQNEIDLNNAHVIITGHSRGGAVANLTAKYLIDDDDFVPSVCAYTFATPNVTPNDENNTLENYDNILNFCKTLDLVPYIPLTNNSWGYWKYGKTYIEIYDENYVYCNQLADIMADKEFAPTVEEYYHKKFQNKDNKEEKISLYNYMQDTLATPMSDGAINIFKSRNLMNNYGKKYKNLSKLSNYFSKNLFKLSNHQPGNYKKLELNNYIYFSYDEALSRCTVGGLNEYILDENVLTSSSNFITERNSLRLLSVSDFSELQSIKQFLLCADENEMSNIAKLGWDIDDTSTWTGITFNESGNITKIDLPFKDLYGTLNLSNFDDLEYVDISANWIDAIYLLNDTALTYLDVSDNELQSCIVSTNTALEYLDCSFNNIGSLDVSNNTAITELNCTNCGLSTLDISDLSNLETLNCSFNNLNNIDITYNAQLSSLYCMMNYLDLTDSALMNGFDTVSNRDNGDVVYQPQYLSHNTVFDNNELNAIQAIGAANTELDIVSDGTLNFEKMQEYFEFEKVNGVYRVCKIYLDDENISGALDCSAFTKLKEIYCDNTNITSLNLSTCTEIEIISCSNSELANLILPNNTSQTNNALYDLECENNHLDINIFTNSIVENIESKENSILSYKHQRINADVEDFNETDYSALCNIYNQFNNSEILGWDLSNPGYFSEIDWKYDLQTQTYRIYDCDFSLKKITGNVDFSNCSSLKDFSFLGTQLFTVELPNIDIPDYAFYDCKRLEAITVASGATNIGDLAFFNDKILQGVYVPNTVVNIGVDAFENCEKITLAGAESSYAATYAQTNDIPFEAGYFVCGNVVVKQTSNGGHSGNYPVDGAAVSRGESTAVTDKYGYFVSFGLSNGEYNFDLTRQYGWDLDIDAVINNSPMVITDSIPMVICDYNNDGFINGRDLAYFTTSSYDSTNENFKYYDINKDGVKDSQDWAAIQGILGDERPSVQQELTPRALLKVAPQKQYKNNTEHYGIEILEGEDD